MSRLLPIVTRCGLVLVILAGCQSREVAPPPEPTSAPWTDPSPHRQGFITANGISLNYLDWGGTGQPLILIHGNGQNPHVFDDLVPALGNGFRVVAYARRGSGRSGKVGPFDTATFTEDLRALMDSLGIARAHLAGWSLGGNEITMMAGKYPNRVDRLVYLDAAYDWADPASVAALKELPVDFAPPAAAFASLVLYRAWFLREFLPTVTDPTAVEAFVRDQVDVQGDGTVQPVTSDTVAQAVFTTVFTDRRDYSKVKSPALAIYSETFLDTTRGDSAQRAKNLAWEKKHMAPFREKSIARVKRQLKSVEIVTVPGTHADFVFTSRDRVTEAMRRFLSP